MDEKMKKMGEMQLSSVTDSKKKKTILDQVIVLPCLDPDKIVRSLKGFFFGCFGIVKHHQISPRQPVIQDAEFFIVTVGVLHSLFVADC